MTTAQKVSFDIFNLTAPIDKPVTFNVDLVFDEDGNAVAGYVIVGKNSPEYKAESHAARAEGYKKAAVRKTSIDQKTDEGSSKLVDLIDENSARLATAVVVGWYGFTTDGVEAPLDKALVRASYAKYPTWEAKVTAAMDADANFLKVSSASSSPTPTTSSAE